MTTSNTAAPANITVYGITNCSSVKKARLWLEQQQLPYVFHDFKKSAPDAALLQHWLTQTQLDILINRKGTTWRKLSASEQAAAEDKDSAIRLMQSQPSLIKRPVVDINGKIDVGLPAALEAFARLV